VREVKEGFLLKRIVKRVFLFLFFSDKVDLPGKIDELVVPVKVD